MSRLDGLHIITLHSQHAGLYQTCIHHACLVTHDLHMLHVWQNGYALQSSFYVLRPGPCTSHAPVSWLLSPSGEDMHDMGAELLCSGSFALHLRSCLVLYRDQRAKQKLIEGLTQPGGRSKIGPMAAKKLVGLLTAEDPMTAMDSFAI